MSVETVERGLMMMFLRLEVLMSLKLQGEMELHGLLRLFPS